MSLPSAATTWLVDWHVGILGPPGALGSTTVAGWADFEDKADLFQISLSGLKILYGFLGSVELVK
jgi:hypothetical protein